MGRPFERRRERERPLVLGLDGEHVFEESEEPSVNGARSSALTLAKVLRTDRAGALETNGRWCSSRGD